MNKGRLEGKVVIITGAARGQGEAEARRLVAEGARVVLTDVLDEQGREVAASLGESATYLHLDVSSEVEWDQVVKLTVQKCGRIDVLVNNAGLSMVGTIMDQSPQDFRRVTEVNYFGSYFGMRAVIPKMIEVGGGSIINVASTLGFSGCAGLGAYTGSKHGLVGITKCAAIDLACTGIRVNVVCPGSFDTPMLSGTLEAASRHAINTIVNRIPLRRMGRPEEMAGIVVFLASDDSSYCTGGIFPVDGGMSAGTTDPDWQ